MEKQNNDPDPSSQRMDVSLPTDTDPPVCPWSSSEPPSSVTCLERLLAETSWRHQMPEPPQLTPRNVEEQQRQHIHHA